MKLAFNGSFVEMEAGSSLIERKHGHFSQADD
jgi:hypothetical protein